MTFCTHNRWTLPEEIRPLVVQALPSRPWHETAHACPGRDARPRAPDLHSDDGPEREARTDSRKSLGGIKGASAHTINKQLNRKGPVWQDESFDHILRREEKLEQKVEYIRQNPVRKGLVTAPEEYPYTWVEGRPAQPVDSCAQRDSWMAHEPTAGGGCATGCARCSTAAAGWGMSQGSRHSRGRLCHMLRSPGGRVRSTAGRGRSKSSRCSTRAAAPGISWWRVPACSCRCGCTTKDCPRRACDAVLRENLFGLELDPRCTQIAAFALALAAWTYPDRMGSRWDIAPCRP